MPVCACCGSPDGVEMEDARTQYHFEGIAGSEQDPNRPIPLCRLCADEHHAHWNEMWAEYRAGLM